MAKITHTTLMFTDLSNLNEIPSELIEPYLVKYMSYLIESVGTGWKTPEQARQQLSGLESFVSMFCGLHARIASNNVFHDFKRLSDEDMVKICKKVCNE